MSSLESMKHHRILSLLLGLCFSQVNSKSGRWPFTAHGSTPTSPTRASPPSPGRQRSTTPVWYSETRLRPRQALKTRRRMSTTVNQYHQHNEQRPTPGIPHLSTKKSILGGLNFRDTELVDTCSCRIWSDAWLSRQGPCHDDCVHQGCYGPAPDHCLNCIHFSLGGLKSGR